MKQSDFEYDISIMFGRPSRLWTLDGQPTDMWHCVTPGGMTITAPSEPLCRAAWLRWKDR